MYVGIMAVVFVVLFRDQSLLGIFAGLLISGPLYLVFGYVAAKFGYQRKTLKQLRAEAPTKGAPASDDDSRSDHGDAPRPKPPPTSRTGGGNQRPTSKSKRRR
jgi:hypothetical protein